MNYKDLSPGDLATSLDVQRSNISHILNGRNNPGAVFIEKFLRIFPDLNARWLLTGEGDMIDSPSAKPAPSEKNILEPDTSSNNNSNQSVKEGKTGKVKDKNRTNSTDSPLPAREITIDKVLLLRSDGTFVTYKSE